MFWNLHTINMLTHYLLFINPSESWCICSSELSHHTFAPIFTTDPSLALEGRDWAEVHQTPSPWSKRGMKHLLLGMWNTLKKCSIPLSLPGRDDPGFGMFPTALTPMFPGHTEIPNGELSPNSFCPRDSNKSPGESPLLHHTRRQNLHTGI